MENKLSNAEFVNHSFYLDPCSEPFYGEDQAYICFPKRYATVSFYLESSDGLTALADAVREEAGYRPMYPTEKHPHECECDQNGWYDFYIGISAYDLSDPLDSCIDAIVVSDGEEDNEAHYVIDIPDEARELIYKRLDEQAREAYGMSCAELLAESEKEMLECCRYA